MARKERIIFIVFGILAAILWSSLFLMIFLQVDVIAILILALLSFVFSLLPVIYFALTKRKKKKQDWLISNGQIINADGISVDVNTYYRVNGRSPYLIKCQWHDKINNKVHVFKSSNIWYDPSAFITTDHIKVFIDPSDPKKYFVDIGFLLATGYAMGPSLPMG